MQSLSDQFVECLVKTVQHNADVADAQFAGRYPLCVYLMKMRDYFCWHQGLDVCEFLDRVALGEWISFMESRWEALEGQQAVFQALPLPNGEVDCFDNAAVNAVLNPAGYVYAGVHGRGGAPTFFFAHLLQCDITDNPEFNHGRQSSLNLLVSGRELARTMTAPPAMSAPGLIFVRRDALKRYLGNMVEEWSWKREDNAMGKVIRHYDFAGDPQGALDRLLDTEMENVILHEIGERLAGALIGAEWQSLMARIEDSLAEMKIRAVRDNLADCLVVLPACMTLENWTSVDFFYANMTSLRKDLFPSFCEAYQEARKKRNYRTLAPVIAKAGRHWLHVSRALPWCAPDTLENYLNDCAF